ncbi:hypothetical protein RTCIAT899_PB00390 (plasmid) [Rhizobium tropici CIAT 899]|nr:hypothetical protein RTCIAT899_PB00390 [Rhizobium tropici CIAT 899]
MTNIEYALAITGNVLSDILENSGIRALLTITFRLIHRQSGSVTNLLYVRID